MIDDPLNAGMGCILASLIGMENVWNPSFPYCLLQNIEHQLRGVVQSDLPGDHFTREAINHRCKVEFRSMEG